MGSSMRNMNTTIRIESEEANIEDVLEKQEFLPVSQFLKSLGPITPENAEMLVSVLSSYVQLLDNMEGMVDKMDVLEEEHEWMKREIMLLKHKVELVNYEDPPSPSIRSELWRLFIRAWNENTKSNQSAMDPAVIANNVITNPVQQGTTTFQKLWEN